MAGFIKWKKYDWEVNGDNGYCLWIFGRTSKQAHKIVEDLRKKNPKVSYTITPLKMWQSFKERVCDIRRPSSFALAYIS